MVKKFGQVLVSTFIAIMIFCVSGCYKGPEENCVFIGEKVNLHEEYIATVISVANRDSIQIIKNENDNEKSEILGRDEHFIEVAITLKRNNIAKPKEDHVFKNSDFKLKDHTGISIANLNIASIKDGLALSQKDFSTRKALEDYEWIGKELKPGEEKNITIYFEMTKELSVDDTIMILEIDFFATKIGSDIVLGNRTK